MRTLLLLAGLLGLLYLPALATEVSLDLTQGPTSPSLQLLTGGDGNWRPAEFEGSQVVEFGFEPEAFYLYFKLDQATWPSRPLPLYVSIEFLDRSFATGFNLQYDQAGKTPYEPASGYSFGIGSGLWRTAWFELPDAAVSHRQNLQADFRLSTASSTLLRRVTVTDQPTTGASRDQLSAEIEALAPKIPDDFLYTVGANASLGEIKSGSPFWKLMGFKDVELYVTWRLLNDDPAVWDFSQFDAMVDELQTWELKWMPFLIAGPAYATPMWYRNSPDSVFTKCLEHEQGSRIQSIFNPDLVGRVDEFLRQCGQHWNDDRLNYILLGVSGTYGESIYAAGPEGGWTASEAGEDYHNHGGFWAAEPEAIASFQDWLKARYGEVDSLNQAWGKGYTDFGQIKTFIPGADMPRRMALDMALWYTQAMTDWSAVWTDSASKHFPGTPVYLCTGGHGIAMLGADFAAQAQMLARFPNTGIRITNEASNYLSNFDMTRMVASACRFYDIGFGFEPAGYCDHNGIVGRLYNDISSGANQFHDYHPNPFGNAEYARNMHKYSALLGKREPLIDVAVFQPKPAVYLDEKEMSIFYGASAALRQLVDVDFVDSTLVADGALEQYKLLVLPNTRFEEEATLQALLDWVEAGGVAVVAKNETPWLETVEGSTALRDKLLGDLVNLPETSPVVPETPELGNRRAILEVGAPGDELWLSGDWFGPEIGPEEFDANRRTWRWMSRSARVNLPVWFEGQATLYVGGNLFGENPISSGRLLLDGKELGQLTGPQDGDYMFEIPAADLAGKGRVTLEFDMKPLRGFDIGISDSRELGFLLNYIDFGPTRANRMVPAKLAELGLKATVAEADLLRCSRSLGEGKVFLMPTSQASATELASFTWAVIEQASALGLGEDFIPLLDGQFDGVYCTLTTNSLLWFNDTDESKLGHAVVKGKTYKVDLEPHSIQEQPL